MVATQFDAVSILSEWHKTHRQVFAECNTQTNFVPAQRGAASIEFTSSTYIMQIDVWNNAWAIDVQIIDLATYESTFPIVGPTDDRRLFEEKLDEFLRWFEDAHQTAA